MSEAYDWNDLRAFLAVAREGSTLAASRALGINQTTVARRIEALEGRLKLKLFDRGQSGSRLSEAGKALLAEAEAVEAAAGRFLQKATVQQRGLGGVIRVTCSEATANSILTPSLPQFRRLYPDISVELALSDARLDVAAGEADIAIRGAPALEDSDLIVRKVSEISFAPYCSFDYVRTHGLPTLENLAEHHLIDTEGDLANLPGMVGLRARAEGADFSYRCNSMTNLELAVRSGVGIGIFACQAADTELNLLQVYPPDDDARSVTWILTRAELKNVPRVRAFIDFISPQISSLVQDLERRATEIRDQKTALIAALLASLPSRPEARA